MTETRRLLAATVMLLFYSAAPMACSDSAGPPEGPSARDREDWQAWAAAFVVAACAHDEACGIPTGSACIEVGFAAAEGASCDAAVSFFLSNRSSLEACIAPYPDDCDLTPTEACPATAGHPLEELCR